MPTFDRQRRGRARLAFALGAALLLVSDATAAAGAVEVELLTIGSGEEIFASFGHAALRVRHGDGRDQVYNYGHTRFGDPRLVLDFLRGRARFWVGRHPFASSLEDYRLEDRSIYRQRLTLRPEQHDELARLLAENLRPDRRYYRYHHFKDNCATRLRDLIDRVSGGVVRKQLSARPTGKTYRELVREGFASRLGVLLLGELLLGRALDRPVDAWEGAFLPRILAPELRQVRLEDGRALASAPELLFRGLASLPSAGVDPGRGVLLLWVLTGAALLLGAGVLTAARRRCRLAAGLLLAPLGLALGVTALTVWGLVVATLSHLPELSGNENLLHLWPSDLLLCVVAVRFLRGRFHAGRLLRSYALLRTAVASLALLGYALGLLRQPLPPLVLSLGLGLVLLLLCRGLPRAPTPTRAANGLPARSLLC